MMKKSKININEITRIVSKMPKTLNEAVYEDFSGFNDITEGEELEGKPMPQEQPAPEQAPMEQPAPAPAEPQPEEQAPMAEPEEKPMENGDGDSLNVEQFVDDIRKKSLRGMAQLAENPDDERYQLLKKIWQICDKKPEQQTAFSNPNGQMQQPAPKKI